MLDILFPDALNSKTRSLSSILFDRHAKTCCGLWVPLHLFERLARKVGQDEARAVHLLVVVPAQLVLFLAGPGAERLAQVAVRVLGGDEEADLARGIGGDGGVGVFDHWEDLAHQLLQVGDELKVEPLVFGWKTGMCLAGTGERGPAPAS